MLNKKKEKKIEIKALVYLSEYFSIRAYFFIAIFSGTMT